MLTDEHANHIHMYHVQVTFTRRKEEGLIVLDQRRQQEQRKRCWHSHSQFADGIHAGPVGSELQNMDPAITYICLGTTKLET